VGLSLYGGLGLLAEGLCRFAADSNGRCVPFTGAIEGDRFTITSDGATIGGAPVRLRMVWEASDPEVMTWRNEMSVAGGPWALIEEYEMMPAWLK
jgi:hypothetical protein